MLVRAEYSVCMGTFLLLLWSIFLSLESVTAAKLFIASFPFSSRSLTESHELWTQASYIACIVGHALNNWYSYGHDGRGNLQMGLFLTPVLREEILSNLSWEVVEWSKVCILPYRHVIPFVFFFWCGWILLPSPFFWFWEYWCQFFFLGYWHF